MATTKTKGTNSKIKELKAEKPVQVTDAELKSIQSIVDRINNAQMNIGQLEARKHQVLHMLAGTNDELALIQEKLQKEYGTNDVNIKDGTINYPADVEADS
jgi:ppGpp synthetase/RelA/SpoT-type nucleotidyltranferase|tara:strand:- start:88 stop:390 length:303 start_codon:yes stop_codon:yes gene_type:complete